ncbi:MmcQ/YjbR family DNA-binding protein [Actinocorallia lasiicapitis]
MDAFEKLIMGLPEVVSRPGFGGMTSFRARDKGFAYLDEAEATVLLKATRAEQAALIGSDPAVYGPSWASGRFAWVTIDLPAADPQEVAELVTEAWLLSVPKLLAATLGQAAGPPGGYDAP